MGIDFGFTFPPLNLLIALLGTIVLALLIMRIPLRGLSASSRVKRSAMRRLAAGNEPLLFAAAATVVAVHAAVDSFIGPEPGTKPGDHLARGLVTLALLGLAVAAYPRLRAGARAAVAAALGALALEGALLAVRDAGQVGARGEDWTGFLLGPAGVVLLALAATLAYRSRKPGRLRWLRRSGISIVSLIGVYWIVLPVAVAILATHRPRADVVPVQLGGHTNRSRSPRVTVSTSPAGTSAPTTAQRSFPIPPAKARSRRRDCSPSTATASFSWTRAATTAARATPTSSAGTTRKTSMQQSRGCSDSPMSVNNASAESASPSAAK